MKYYMGIDLGGTKCDVLISDENGKIVNRYIGPGWNDDDFLGGQIDCMKTACHKSNLEMSDLYAVVASMTGIDSENIRLDVTKSFSERTGLENISVYPEDHGSMRAETKQKPCCLLICGTGAGGAFFIADGSYIPFSNYIPFEYEGGGALGQNAFCAACKSTSIFGEPTCLVDYLCEYTNKQTLIEAMESCWYGQNPHPYQHFAPYVFKAAYRHDKIALRLINNMGYGLSQYIRKGIESLKLTDNNVLIVLTGGLFKGNGRLLEMAIEKNLSDFPNLQFHTAIHEPVYGALMLAYDEYNVTGEEIIISEDDIVKYNLRRKLPC